MKKRWTYRRAGVNVEEIRRAHADIGKLVEETFRFRRGMFGEVLSRFGHYASLIDVGDGRALALHTDGVGTKVLIAQLVGKYDTIGIDCVAMCVNDIICLGVEPLALIDYLAVQKADRQMIGEIMKGLVRGAEEAGIAIVGGETAVMPDVIKGAIEGRGFDLVATVIGIVEKEKIITGERMKAGDVVIGLRSSGIHSNGITLARKILFDQENLSISDKVEPLETTLGEELLKPTTIYVKPILKTIKRLEVHALANITGGAYTKLARFKDYSSVGFKLDRMPKPQPIFELIQRLGNVSDEEMYKTFNMGIGFLFVVPKGQAEDALGICEEEGFEAQVVGSMADRPEISIRTPRGNWIRYGMN